MRNTTIFAFLLRTLVSICTEYPIRYTYGYIYFTPVVAKWSVPNWFVWSMYTHTLWLFRQHLNNCMKSHYQPKSRVRKMLWEKVIMKTLIHGFLYAILEAENRNKKCIVVTARVHPGETNSSWMMRGLLDYVTGPTAVAKVTHYDEVTSASCKANDNNKYNPHYEPFLGKIRASNAERLSMLWRLHAA